MNYLLIVNPYGGKKSGKKILQTIKPLFDKTNDQLFIIETAFAGHAKEIANQYNFNNLDGLLFIGGDGTLQEIINGMLSRNDKKQIPIGIIPGGSGNSYAKDLNLSDPINAVNTIKNHKLLSVDTAKVNINHITTYANNMVGWGLVTDIGKSAEKYRWLGPSRYTIMSILEVFKYKDRYTKLIIDNNIINDHFVFIIACNSQHVGKGMKMAPKAKLNDGLIDIITVKGGVSKFRLLKVLPKLFDGSHLNEPEISYFQASSFSIIPEIDETLNIDGEVLGTTPVKVEVINNAFKVFY